MSSAQRAPPFQRIADDIASADCSSQAAEASGSPTASRSSGSTSRIVPGVSP
jgi:hypothetical protein